MNRFCLAFLLSGLFAMGLTAQDGNKRIDLKEVTDGAFNQISSIGELRSLPDGEHYTVLNKDRNRIVKYSYRTGQPVDTLFDVKTARECTFDKIEGYDISSTGYRILVWNEKEPIYRHSFRAMVYDYDVRRNLVKPLSESKEKIMIPTFSPDGRMCAFVVNNNIWLKKFDYDSEVQITKDGVPNQIINGTTDWVYEEEFGITNLMAWAPNSEYLAFVRFDETEVPEYSMQIYGENYYPGFYNYRYPKAGEKNSKVTLHSYSIETKDIKTLTLPVKEEYYIPGITFTTNPDQLAVMTLNRTQNQFNLYYTNPKSGVSRLILNDQSETYIDSEWLNSIRFYNTGFTYVGEKDGYAHVYLYSPTGVLLRQVTSGNWDVTRLLGWDTETGAVYYESAEESPLRRSVYRIDTKGKKTKLSTQEGTNAADFSANFAYYVNRYSNVREPMQITVHETKTGKVLRTLQDNAALKQKLAGYRYSPKEFFTVETASGFELNAWIVKPKDFSESKKYPVLMVQYSGPNSQEVLDKYSLGW